MGGPRNAENTICLLDASPVGSPRQNSELADSASRGPSWGSSPLTTWIALSGSSTATWMHPEDQLTPGDVLELVDQRVVAVLRGDPLALEEAEQVRPGRARSPSLAATSVT